MGKAAGVRPEELRRAAALAQARAEELEVVEPSLVVPANVVKKSKPFAAGMAIGITGDAGVRANAQQPKLFTGILLIFIFSEALALYGLIVGIILASAGSAAVKPE